MLISGLLYTYGARLLSPMAKAETVYKYRKVTHQSANLNKIIVFDNCYPEPNNISILYASGMNIFDVCECSAFMIGNGKLLTNAHCVEHDTQVITNMNYHNSKPV